jgi:hypothetical protein
MEKNYHKEKNISADSNTKKIKYEGAILGFL